MAQKSYWLVRVETQSDWPGPMSLEEVAARAGVHPQLLDRFVYLGLVDPVERGVHNEPLFASDAVPLVRKILRLRHQLGVNYAGIGLVLDLLEEIERLESRVNHLEHRMSSRDEA
jgi:DNA-binding transcriptional MerR regulator